MNLARRFVEAFTLIRTVYPQCFARARIGGDDIAPLVHGEVEDAVDHDRRRLAAGLRIRQQAVGLPDPGDFQILDIVAIDLIEWRVMRTPILPSETPPFPALRALLRNGRMDPEQRGDQKPQTHYAKQSRHSLSSNGDFIAMFIPYAG